MDNTQTEGLELVLQENARLTAILYSIFKRHPDAAGWSLVLDDIDQDVPPDPLIVGWNVIGNSAIITLVFGETRQAMIEAANDKRFDAYGEQVDENQTE